MTEQRANIFKCTVVLIITLELYACSKNPLSDIDIDDFHPEPQIGVYNISQRECELMLYRKVIRSDSPIGCERLKKVVFNFYPLTGDQSNINTDLGHQNELKTNAVYMMNKPSDELNDASRPRPNGALIVLDVVADEVLSLFEELYQLKFPIKSAIPIEYFSKKERLTENMNNSLAFDSRPITDGDKWSEHAYGAAIDINPLQNPYFYIKKSSKAILIPQSATEGYLNRAKYRVGKPVRAGMSEKVTTVFAKHGFVVWGGDWNMPIDYMHFQIGSRQFIEQLVALPLKDAKALFNHFVIQVNQCFEEKADMNDIAHLRKYCVDRIFNAFDM
ncbi:M15 family metallopeptidase [Microbulbifer epialgicus]|uniref:M15 family metallopeptidase n=1 Tax=Microbulbifer epialgicus TaxID=393907 RepID=A0ABV4NYR1_9GAMM